MTEIIGNALNSPTSTLSSSITSGSASIPVNAPTAPDTWPLGGNFRVRIGTEIIVVNAATGSATSLTVVTRGAEGTTAASHASSDAVDVVLTKKAVDLYVMSFISPGDVPPDTASAYDDEFDDASIDAKWAWRNQSTATIAEAGIVETLVSPSGSSGLNIREQVAPAADFTLSAKFDITVGSSPECGIVLVNNSNGKLIVFDAIWTTPIPHPKITRWTNATTFASTVADASGTSGASSWYLRITKTGSGGLATAGTLTFYWSMNGISWVKVTATTETVAGFLGSLDRFGFFGSAIATMDIHWFRVTTP